MDGMATEPAIGTKIKRARERKRWTQRHLAELIGVSQKTIDNWENGRTGPKSSIGALEEVLGVSLDGTPAAAPEISRALRTAIENEDGLTPQERQAVIDAVRETLATERGASGPSGPRSGRASG